MNSATPSRTPLVAGVAKISAGSEDLGAALKATLLSATVERELNAPSMLRATYGILGLLGAELVAVNLKSIAPGARVSAKMGFDKLVSVFGGKVAALEPTFAGDESKLEVRAFDALFDLQFGTKRRAFPESPGKDITVTDSQIAQQIAGEHGLTAHADTSHVKYPYVLQRDESDYDFLLRCAARTNYEIFVDGAEGTDFHFRKPAITSSTTATLAYGIDFTRFAVKLAVLKRDDHVKRTSWDVQNKTMLTGATPAGAVDPQMGGTEGGYSFSRSFGDTSTAGSHAAIFTQDSTEALATAARTAALETFIEGEASGPGMPSLVPGVTVAMTGVGSRFDGTYYVTRVMHRYDASGAFTTTFNVLRTGI